MPRFYFRCNYCGFFWDDYFFAGSDKLQIKCSKCHDSDIKVIKNSEWDRDPFGYEKGKE